MSQDDHLKHVPRWAAGSCGGLASSLAQFIGGPMPEFASHVAAFEASLISTDLIVFGIATTMLMLLGGIIGYFVKTTNRWTAFLAGAAGVSLLTQALPAVKPLLRADFSIVSTAAAQSAKCGPEGDLRGTTITGGLKYFFGLNDEKYKVVIGWFKSLDDANKLMSSVSKEDKSIPLFIVEPNACNPYYEVSSEYLFADKAKSVQQRLLRLKSVSGAFLSPEAQAGGLAKWEKY